MKWLYSAYAETSSGVKRIHSAYAVSVTPASLDPANSSLQQRANDGHMPQNRLIPDARITPYRGNDVRYDTTFMLGGKICRGTSRLFLQQESQECTGSIDPSKSPQEQCYIMQRSGDWPGPPCPNGVPRPYRRELRPSPTHPYLQFINPFNPPPIIIPKHSNQLKPTHNIPTSTKAQPSPVTNAPRTPLFHQALSTNQPTHHK